jgi:hypothetical protein
LKTKFSRKENIDSGLALLLILLLSGIFLKMQVFYKISVGCVLIIMIKPVLIYPFTFLWLNLSDVLGKIVSKIILTIIYCIVLLPVALLRKIVGKDNLKLKQFHRSDKSVFFERNHLFTKDDMLNPF